MNEEEYETWGKIIGAVILIFDILVFAGLMGIKKATGSYIGSGEYISGQLLILITGIILVIYVLVERK